ncbi:Trk system potassium transporter TrkA [Christensenellaceae bacterium OttesenSCG-928-K19]|nr:Trk system potassium transporter TrkA [Christensenellaceae bacterium OttesenSCG-928-K19]
MRIVIVGDGKVGSALSEELSLEGHDVVVIDSNKAVLREALEELDVMVVHGNGAAMGVQKAADVGESDLLIAATSADEINLLCCIVARKLGCPNTIARVRNPDYTKQLFELKEELGLSMAVNPEFAAASEVFQLLQFPSFLQRDSFSKGRVEIVELELKEGSKLIEKKLSELYKIAKVQVLVCAVERQGVMHIPDGNFMLHKNDTVSFVASTKDLAQLIRNLGLVHRKVRDVMIVGGSRTAFYLAHALIETGAGVKLIEIKEDRCLELADALPKAVVVNADGTDKHVLDAEGIEHTDAVVTLTGMDEENLIVSMYAEYKGVPKVVTKMNRTEYYEVFRDKGIDSVVSPKEICTDEIVRYVRAMQVTEDNSVITLRSIGNGAVEALEFKATRNTFCLGMTLMEVQLKPHILIACITKGDKVIIPRGNDRIEEGDNVIIVTSLEAQIKDLNDIFAAIPAKREYVK